MGCTLLEQAPGGRSTTERQRKTKIVLLSRMYSADSHLQRGGFRGWRGRRDTLDVSSDGGTRLGATAGWASGDRVKPAEPPPMAREEP